MFLNHLLFFSWLSHLRLCCIQQVNCTLNIYNILSGIVDFEVYIIVTSYSG